jgi:hypothetical protein
MFKPAHFFPLACLFTFLVACQTPAVSTPTALAADPTPLSTEASPSLPAASPPSATPSYPFPQHLTYAPNTIRPNHISQTQQDDDVRTFYAHWKETYLVPAGETPDGYPLYRVSFGQTNPDRTVSEGQGFGMTIVAIMAGHDPQAQEYFDGLWEFSRAHPSDGNPHLMGWQVPPSGGNNSAFDGDADIAHALLLAGRQWGSTGRINYQAEAEQVIAAIAQSTIGPASHLPLLGDWINPNGSPYNQYTVRSSDFMPAHFRAYAHATNDLLWQEVIGRTQATIAHLQSTASPTTGLLPDFIIPTSPSDHTPQPAPPHFLEGPHDGHYFYNAGRDPWRIAVDALLYDDPTSRQQASKMSLWAESTAEGNPQAIQAGYTLDGTPVEGSDYFSTFFVAPFGVAAMTVPSQQQWLNAIYDAVSTTHQDYYEDSVTLLCLLILTGNYWGPIPSDLSLNAYLPYVTR